MTETFELGKDRIACSRVGLGGCPLGGYGWGTVDDEQLRAAVREALDCGINFFDTADCYGFGQSELLLSQALEDKRHEVILCTKFGVRWDEERRTRRDTSPAYLREALDASLKRLRIDCVPLYYLHWPDGTTPIAETIGELRRCRDEGKIGEIGVSNLDAQQLTEASREADIAVLQLRASIVRQRGLRDIQKAAQETSVPIVTWGSLGEGLLAGRMSASTRFEEGDRRNRYNEFQGEQFQRNLRVAGEVKGVAEQLGHTAAQLALRWLLDTEGVGASLFGAKRPAQVRDNAGALGWSLDPTAYERLKAAGEAADLDSNHDDN